MHLDIPYDSQSRTRTAIGSRRAAFGAGSVHGLVGAGPHRDVYGQSLVARLARQTAPRSQRHSRSTRSRRGVERPDSTTRVAPGHTPPCARYRPFGQPGDARRRSPSRTTRTETIGERAARVTVPPPAVRCLVTGRCPRVRGTTVATCMTRLIRPSSRMPRRRSVTAA